MSHSLKNLKKSFQGLLSLPRRVKHWDILFIDNHGKIVSFQYVRGLFVLFVALVLLLLTVAMYLYFLKDKTIEQNRDLQKTVILSRQQIDVLQNDMDQLMVRLADAQSKIPKKPAMQKPPSKTPPPVIAKTVKKPEPPVLTKERKPEKKLPKIVEKKVPKVPGVYEFLAFFDAVSETLNARFVIKNTIANGTRLSGYVFVIMKDLQEDEKTWVPIPDVKIASGKPMEFKAGKFFKIRNFMTMQLSMKDIKGPKVFNKATVFIFSLEGKLIFEKTYRIKINIAAPPPPPEISRPAPATAITPLITPPADQAISPEKPQKNDAVKNNAPDENPKAVIVPIVTE